jgi:uncharacterized membrane protein YraQ (UPF0718 family)
MTAWLHELWFLTLEASPWLLLGLAIAAIIKAYSDRLPIARYLAGESPAAVTRAALIGAPLPLCSCGVVPAVLGLRDAGAGRGPSMAFLVATPETGPDSISVSYGLLGPVYAIARPLAAVVGAIVTGLIAAAASRGGMARPTHEDRPEAEGCCSAAPADTGPCSGGSGCGEDDACGSGEPATPPAPVVLTRLRHGADYAFGQVLRDILPWMIVGLLIAATAVVLVPEGFFDSRWGLAGSYLLMAVIGIPMYVCATASTPIAAGLLIAGMSPGAALVFLLAGPATNIGTLGILRRHFGNRLIAVYLVSVIGSALVAGITLDLLWRAFDWRLPGQAPAGQAMHADWVAVASLVLLVLAGLRAYGGKRRRRRPVPTEGGCDCSQDRHGSR